MICSFTGAVGGKACFSPGMMPRLMTAVYRRASSRLMSTLWYKSLGDRLPGIASRDALTMLLKVTAVLRGPTDAGFQLAWASAFRWAWNTLGRFPAFYRLASIGTAPPWAELTGRNLNLTVLTARDRLTSDSESA